MDLMGPVQVEILDGRIYVFVYVDDFSRYTWVDFIWEKIYTFIMFKILYHQLQLDKGKEIGKIVQICSDHGKKFEKSSLYEFCSSEGISHESSSSITP